MSSRAEREKTSLRRSRSIEDYSLTRFLERADETVAFLELRKWGHFRTTLCNGRQKEGKLAVYLS